MPAAAAALAALAMLVCSSGGPPRGPLGSIAVLSGGGDDHILHPSVGAPGNRTDVQRLIAAARRIPVGVVLGTDTKPPAFVQALGQLRAAGVTIYHYTWSRAHAYPNGSYEKCCHCCGNLSGIFDRVRGHCSAYPADGEFIDNGPFKQSQIAAAGFPSDFYLQIYNETQRANRTAGTTRPVVMNPGDIQFEEM